MDRSVSWLTSAGIHGALLLGALLVGWEGIGGGEDSAGGFRCTIGEPAWRVPSIERPGDGITWVRPDPVEGEPVEFLMPHGPTPCVVPQRSLEGYVEWLNQRSQLVKDRKGEFRRCTCTVRFLGFDRNCPMHSPAFGWRVGSTHRFHIPVDECGFGKIFED